MSMLIGEKLKLIRERERLNRPQFFDITGIHPDTLKNWESGKNKSIASDKLELITKSAPFKKYALWLITGETAPESGQISPSDDVKYNDVLISKTILTSAFERTMHTSISLGWLTPKDGINFGMLSDVFLSDFEAVGGQVTVTDSPELAPTGTSSKT